MPGDIFRGVRLPEGMTPDLAARLESQICDYIDRANGSEGDGPISLPFEFGIALFAEIAGTLRSSSPR
jgi:hypothetical protein